MKVSAEAKKQKEIARLEKEQAKQKWKGYIAYLLFVVTVIYIADEVVSQINTQMQSVIASQVFAPLVGDEFAVARLTAVGTFTMISTVLAMFYRPLSDRFGRKIFLVINTLGMGVGIVIIGLCTSIPVYILGAMIIGFFTPHDMQAVYVQECAPPEHRGKMYSTVKCFATVGIVLIPVLRSIFIKGADMSGWRFVYIIPGLIAIVAAIIALIGIRESDAFIESRLRTLKMSDEDREKEAQNARKANGEKTGIIQGMKFLFSHKQTRWILVAYCALMLGICVTTYYETILTTGYAQQFVATGLDLAAAKTQATSIVTQALMLFSVGSGLAQLFPGFVADKLGRKKAVIASSVVVLVGFLGYYFGSQYNWNPYFVGALCGACTGAYWALTDILLLMVSESVPTSIRASVATASGLVILVPTMVIMIAVMAVVNILGDAAITTIILATVVPGMLLTILTLLFKVKETNGVDLGAITGDEFE